VSHAGWIAIPLLGYAGGGELARDQFGRSEIGYAESDERPRRLRDD
jgi:hypothetical protein